MEMSWPMCRSKSPPRVVSTKAPAIAGAQMISIVDQPLDVLEHRVSVVAGLGKRGVGFGAEQHRVGPVDADETQLAQALGDGFRVLADVGGERHDRIAGALTDASNAGGGITVKYGAVLGKGDLSRGILRRLPVGVVRAALDVVDGRSAPARTAHAARSAASPRAAGEDAIRRAAILTEVAGSDGGESGAARRLTSTTRRPAR